MEIISFDAETRPIRKGLAAPPPVCFGWSWLIEGEVIQKGLVTVRGETAGDIPSWHSGETTLSSLFLSMARYALSLGSENCRIVNANIVFDFAVLASKDETLLDMIFDLYDAGIIEDPLLREQLIDIARGSLGWSTKRRTAKGTTKKKEYSLGELSEEYLEIELDKITWRTGYARLENVPLAQWPQGAIDYAVLDSEIAGLLWFAQREASFAEGSEDGEVPDSQNQSKYHFGLHLASVWGIRTDSKEVFQFKTMLVKAKATLLKVLQQVRARTSRIVDPNCEHDFIENKAGARICRTCALVNEPFIRPNGKRNLSAIKHAVIQLAEDARVAPKLTKTGLEKLKKDEIIDENLIKYISLKADDIEDLLAAHELLTPNDLGEALELGAQALERDVDVFDGLSLLSWYLGVEKLLSTYMPALEQGTTRPICARYRPLVETGRASCARPNLMNLPKAPGVRECYIPRKGFLFCSVDYEALELHTLAQVCLELLGESALADALNQGLDPHLLLAVEWLIGGDKLSYDEAKKIRKDETHPRHKEVVKARNIAKCFHPDTEFMTRTGWKKFDELLAGEEIMQAKPREGDTPELSWAVPFNLFRKEATKLVHLHNEGIDLRVTDDHRMLAFNAKGKATVCTPEELGKKRGFWNAGVLDNTVDGIDIPECLLRLAVATQADGSFNKNTKHSTRFGFSKNRKKQRFEWLMQECASAGLDVDYSETGSDIEGEVKSYTVRGQLNKLLRTSLLSPDKDFHDEWRSLCPASRLAVLDEARHWDAHTPSRGVAYGYGSTRKNNCEILQYLATLSGFKTRLVLAKEASGERAAYWKLTVRTKGDSRGESVETTVEDYEGAVVCLSVPESFVVVRSGGVPVITGQCANFGLPGGLGAQKFKDFCKTSGVLISLEEAKDLKEAWFKQWPEMRRYFVYIKTLLEVSDDDLQYVTVEQVFSERIRGKARYTAACNSYFQGLAADGAKLAVYELSKACYRSDGSLSGSRLVVFVHDETIMEHPNLSPKDCHDRCMEQARIMIDCMKKYTPSVRPKAEPALMARWYKDAAAKYDENGHLRCWSPEEANA